MEPVTVRCTLDEDWSARRADLPRDGSTAGDLQAIQIQILDYLLNRYRDSPEAARLVNSPPSRELYVNDRAAIVLRYLGRDWCPSIASQREAAERVHTIVARGAFGSGRRRSKITAAIRPDIQPRFDHAGERLRLRLSAQDPMVRKSAAIDLLGVGEGTLEDIGLLLDLLQLPCSENEQAILIFAARRLAEIGSQVPTPSAPSPPPIKFETPPKPAPEPISFDPGLPLPDWTCGRCGAAISWYLETCQDCGARYLAGEAPQA